jgi:hypothetical protein
MALVLGQLTWVLNYSRLSSPQGGALLLLAFYTLAGLMQQYLAGRFDRQVVQEYGAVALIGVLLLALIAP